MWCHWDTSKAHVVHGLYTHALTQWGRDKIAALLQTSFANVFFKANGNVWFLLKISLKQLSETIMVTLPTHICVKVCEWWCIKKRPKYSLGTLITILLPWIIPLLELHSSTFNDSTHQPASGQTNKVVIFVNLTWHIHVVAAAIRIFLMSLSVHWIYLQLTPGRWMAKATNSDP